MSPLDTAVPLKQIDGITVCVPKHLNLHVPAAPHQEEEDGDAVLTQHHQVVNELSEPTSPGILDKLLYQHDVIVEGLSGLSSR